MINKIRVLLIFTMLMGIIIWPSVANADSGLIEISVEYGNGETINDGTDVPVEVTIKNLGGEFSGVVGVAVLVDYTSVVSYEKEFSISGNSEKTISIVIPADSVINIYEGMLVSVYSNDGEILKSKNVDNINISMGNEVIVGTLTDDYNGISYFDAQAFDYMDFYGSTLIKEYNETTFPDNKSVLDICDYLIIDDYNTEKLSSSQLEALFQWVEDGGCLIIGLGGNYSKVLSGLDSTKTGVTANESEEKELFVAGDYRVVECAKLTYSGDYNQQMENSGFYYKELGMGSVSALEYSLTDVKDVDYSDQNSNIVYEILTMAISKKLANELSVQAQLNSVGDSYYYAFDALSRMTMIEIPKAAKYNILYLIYIILIGPGIYLILKIIKRREILFPVIVGTSVLFVLIVMLLSLKYVIKEQQYATINIKQVDGNNSYVESYFNCLNPDSKDVFIKFSESVVSASTLSTDSYGENYKGLKDKPKYRFREGNGGNTLRYKPDEAFENNCFSAKIKDKPLDGFDMSIKNDKTGLKGYVTNKTDCKFEALVVYYNETGYCIKDVQPGQKVSFEGNDFYSAYQYSWIQDTLYRDFDYSDTITYVAGTVMDKLIISDDTVIVVGITKDYKLNYIEGIKDLNSYTCFYDYYSLENK